MRIETIKIQRRNLARVSGIALAALVLFASALLSGAPALAAQEDGMKAFPGAQGWAAYTPGGRGGEIIRVTNLNADGPGSFAEAARTKGPRIIVFEVGGVIDLNRKPVRISEPFATVAGQTAPSPGITFIRGGLRIEAHDVIVRHIRVLAGEAGAAKRSGWEVDSIAVNRTHNVIVDHCTCIWATDENLSASGPRFSGGPTVEDWRKATAHRVTFSNCIIANGLSRSTHAKGEHSKGTLIHDNAVEIALIGNLYANNVQRNPLFKGGVRGAVVNNFISNPGNRAIHYGLLQSEWRGHEFVNGQMSIVGNVMEHGPDTKSDVTLFRIGGQGKVELYFEDNIAHDVKGNKVEMMGGETRDELCVVMEKKPLWPEGLKAMPAAEVKAHVSKNAGARPWDRDAIDEQIVREAMNKSGKIIDSEQEMGGYPEVKETKAAFNPEEWNLDTMERK